MGFTLTTVVHDFAQALERVDARYPQAMNVRSKDTYQPGIGAFPEAQAVALIADEMKHANPDQYAQDMARNVSYPGFPRQKCDLCLGRAPNWQWAIEVKMVRFFGDNGKLNDNILMHVLSPYPEHRSALTDSTKLVLSQFTCQKALLVYGFEYPNWPLEPAIAALEALMRAQVSCGPRITATLVDLIHPVHKRGSVFAWEIAVTQ